MSPKNFITAAKLIDSYKENFCCCALDEAANSVNTVEEAFFHRLYAGRNRPEFPYFGRTGIHANRERRVIALLLAYEVAMGGGL